jgi:hypothetical protein
MKKIHSKTRKSATPSPADTADKTDRTDRTLAATGIFRRSSRLGATGVLSFMGAALLTACAGGPGDDGVGDGESYDPEYAAFLAEQESESIDTISQGATYVNNGNRTVVPWTTPLKYPLGSIGRLLPVSCTASLIAPNKVITAAHCVQNRTNQTFTPHASNVAANVTRAVQGRDWYGVQTDGSASYGDWAILTLDRSFPTLAVYNITVPSAPPYAVNLAGYSSDLVAAGQPNDALGIHENCNVKLNLSGGLGLAHDCDVWGGASGSPVYRISNNTAQLLAVHSSGVEQANLTWSSNNTNRAASAKFFAFAPQNAAGLSVGYKSDGRIQVYASDSDLDRVGTRWKVDTSVGGAWKEWQPHENTFWGARKMTAFNLQDNRQDLVVINADGYVYTRWEMSLDGTWSNWVNMPTPVLLKDIAAIGKSGVVTQLFALGTNNTVYTQYKLGDANSNWSSWCSLGSVSSATSIAALRYGSTNQVFVSSSSGAMQTTWSSSGNTCADYRAFTSFAGSGFRAVSAGQLADGRLHVQAVTMTGALQERVRSLGGVWSGWLTWTQPRPQNITGFTLLATARLPNGAEQIFAIGDTGEIFTSQESGGAFGPWQRFYL